ncbi:cyclopentanol dehydrogenase [Acuticoccus sediminis]|uniref:Cyclopentanol dehydrogenase n=1 Tax=Acuticoccus sediminis TaxID=2184697 RepID=A0A8B2NLZ0_9HYPH|nr:SDR family oxidoreductase [Acuticoccus sediminis]RAH97465.1 cyclopentanol dehydrogenase [Acuticoccus sediminis]
MTKLENRCAVVTGAARGQGLAEATLLAEHGASVVICDVLVDAGEATARSLRDRGLAVTFAPLDVASEADWKRVADDVGRAQGRLDILVNNAGIINRTSIRDTEPGAWRRLIDINLTGAFLGIRQVADLMAAGGGGAVVNISSNSGFSAHYDPAYTASKWALRGLTRAAAMEFAPAGIRVNAVCPGLVLTDLNTAAPHLKPMIDMTPLKRGATVEEIAHLVLYLASDEAAFITGEDFLIDGGFIAGAGYRRVSVEAGLYPDERT